MYRNDDNINNNIPSFDDIRKGIDYSLLDDQLKGKKKKDLLIKKVAIGFSSVALVVGGATAIILPTINDNPRIPIQMGEYYFDSKIGSVEGIEFDTESKIELSNEYKEGEGIFVISNDGWNIYGEFSNSTLDSYTYQYKEKINETYYFDFELGILKFDYVKKIKEIIVEVISSDENIKIVFRK